MRNIKYRGAKISVHTHRPLFVEGMRHKRLGKPIDPSYSLLSARDSLSYEHGRLFASMFPAIGGSEIRRADKDLEPHTIRAWNEFVRLHKYD